MNAMLVTNYSNPKRETAACSVHMAMCHARRYRNEMVSESEISRIRLAGRHDEPEDFSWCMDSRIMGNVLAFDPQPVCQDCETRGASLSTLRSIATRPM